MRKTAFLALLLLAGCERAEQPAANTAAENVATENILPTVPVGPPVTDAYLGRWIGVEGMYLVVTPGAAPGQYGLEMQWDLDHTGKFDGKVDGDAIAFGREGAALSLKPTDGAATGLKYLDGKKTCLTVQVGEGYCRD